MTTFIARDLKVGFNKRKDTYSGLLAYIIYYDENKTLRKEKSFNSWIEKSIEPKEMKNVPTSGFVLNKNVNRYSSFSSNGSKFRIYDPRGFEMEISAENFIAITQTTNINAQELSGEFVYAWEGQDLILLPVNSKLYTEAKEYSDILFDKFDRKTIKEGNTYKTKKLSDLVFLGKFEVNSLESGMFYKNHEDSYTSSKKDVFFNKNTQSFVAINKNLIIAQTSDEPLENFDLLVNTVKDINKVIETTRNKTEKAISAFTKELVSVKVTKYENFLKELDALCANKSMSKENFGRDFIKIMKNIYSYNQDYHYLTIDRTYVKNFHMGVNGRDKEYMVFNVQGNFEDLPDIFKFSKVLKEELKKQRMSYYKELSYQALFDNKALLQKSFKEIEYKVLPVGTINGKPISLTGPVSLHIGSFFMRGNKVASHKKEINF